ncbi:LapD/MoxY N-terminal periplasmic domain-containing protein [Comamonas composti]|uniref:LapD/MoxY N-terminal periplasmic domain-containing protein n=1 Tax=Comamonas composti TaxID=408558 RepID=UPI000420524A|nr:LapD/MoxY N-terminal periplasmic domain-containing protein [Comamonas composti]
MNTAPHRTSLRENRMSLLTRLLLGVSLAMLGLLVGSLALGINAARQYLDAQLRLGSENAASSLALSLSQPSNQDPVTRELLMLALFDSGQFLHIRLISPDGTALFVREQARPARQVPQWFSQLLPLTRPWAERSISNGWHQTGRLSVAVDNSHASNALWHSSIYMSLFSLGAGVLWAVFAASLLRWFQRLLHEEVLEQIQAIGNQTPACAYVRLTEQDSLAQTIDDTRKRVHESLHGRGQFIRTTAATEMQVPQATPATPS